MIALHKYSFSDQEGKEVKECVAIQIKPEDTIESIAKKTKLGRYLRTNERIEIRAEIGAVPKEIHHDDTTPN